MAPLAKKMQKMPTGVSMPAGRTGCGHGVSAVTVSVAAGRGAAGPTESGQAQDEADDREHDVPKGVARPNAVHNAPRQRVPGQRKEVVDGKVPVVGHGDGAVVLAQQGHAAPVEQVHHDAGEEGDAKPGAGERAEAGARG